jgi:hydrogenase maturation protease
MKNKVSVIGLGNILLRDEGIGVHVVEALKKRLDFPEGVQIIDGGTLGLDLLPIIEEMEKVIFVDAVNLNREPGAIVLIEDDDIPSMLQPAFSFHQVGLADLLFAARFSGKKPAKVTLAGIQPQAIETGLGLSETLNRNMDQYLKTILEKLSEWEIDYRGKFIENSAHVPGDSL